MSISGRLATLRPLSLCCAFVAACAPGGGGGGGGTGGTNDAGAGTGGSGGAVLGTGGAGVGTGGAPVGTGGSASGGAGMSSGGAGAGTGGSAAGTGGQDATGGSGGVGSGGSAGRGSAGAGAAGRGGTMGNAGRSGTGGASSGGAGGRGSCMGAVYNAASPPTTVTLSGSLGAHDPAAFVLGTTIYMAATGLGAKTSTNLTTWTGGSNPLGTRPAWIAQMVPAASNLWAPDISFFGGMYHLYYSASSFGCNRSCIGHATRAALDTGSWADQGPVICSNMGAACSSGPDNWNAIDPNIVVDDAGTPWMAFGSFWGGLKMIKLDTTGARADTMVLSIANRPSARGAMEGAWVFKNCGYYYLFMSWDACCDGAYDYNMRVGRSANVTGPYVDKAGTQLMQGGGTLLVQGNASWGAPGHNSVITYNGKTYNIYHALSGGRGQATLRIAELAWDADGWPVSGGP